MSDDRAMEEGRLKKRMPMRYWCVAHQRLAQDANGCDPNLGGTMIPCKTLWGPFTADHSAMDEGRLEEIENIERDLELVDTYDPTWKRVARDLLAEVRRLRDENDALKQQLQALREQDHPCRELVQEIADSKICWSDWAGDYIQWTEDITRKARKALGLKDE